MQRKMSNFWFTVTNHQISVDRCLLVEFRIVTQKIFAEILCITTLAINYLTVNHFFRHPVKFNI